MSGGEPERGDPLAADASSGISGRRIKLLMTRIYGSLVDYANRRLGMTLLRRFDGEDVAQEAFVVFLRYVTLHPEAGGASVLEHRKLLYRIAENCIRNLVQRHRATCRDVRSESDLEGVGLYPVLVGRDDPASAVVACQDLALRVVAELPTAEHREIALALLEGTPPAKIAAQSGCSLRTVQRIRATLEDHLLACLQAAVGEPPIKVEAAALDRAVERSESATL